ncbi:MAG: nitronate monooxygenase [Mesorhizobium sp.]|nr:MAG: nitronate monooxygenase [Mesorhizobium sp.]
MPTRSWPNSIFIDKVAIEIPIVQAAIGSAAVPELAAAVSNAGGLGMLGLGGEVVDAARIAVRKTRALTNRPFGVNVILHWPPDDVFPMFLDEGVSIYSFFWGDCSRFVQRAHRANAIVLHSVGSVDEAKRAADWGVDVIVAQGHEAGGHVRGTVSTMALLPAVVDAVAPLPVLAAGGIADGRGVAAAFALGAAGVWVGTRYLAATEASVHPYYRQRVLAATANDTIYADDLFDIGWPDAPHRTLKNETSELWEKAGRPPTGNRPRQGEVIGSNADGSIIRYACLTPYADVAGNIEAMSMWAGQGVGLVTREQSAADITRELADEAQRIFSRLVQPG